MRILVASAALVLLTACGGSDKDGEAVQDDFNAAEVVEEAGGGAAPEAQAAAGGAAPKAFSQCATCHSTEKGVNGIGPSLAGVYGAKAGHVADYTYSPAMKDSGLTWNDATLNAYLENPQKEVPGTKMTYAGLKDAKQRQEIVGYLKTLK